MSREIRLIAPLAALTFISGCASATINYSPPTEGGQIKNEIIVGESFENVWDKLVQRLSADFFVINNIEKASRIINVSFSTSSPKEYVDCGQTIRTFSGPQGTETFSYRTTDSATYKTVIKNNNIPMIVRRDTGLEGRANIYVAPQANKTKISTNVRYVLNVKVQTHSFAGQPMGATTDAWTFSTKEQYSKFEPEIGMNFACVTKGEIEQKIMNYATQ